MYFLDQIQYNIIQKFQEDNRSTNIPMILLQQKKKNNEKTRSIHKKFIYVRLNMYINIFHGRDQKQSFSETCVFQKSRKRVHERVNICKIEHVYK